MKPIESALARGTPRSRMDGFQPREPVQGSALLVAVGGFARWLPARRVANVDSMVTLWLD